MKKEELKISKKILKVADSHNYFHVMVRNRN